MRRALSGTVLLLVLGLSGCSGSEAAPKETAEQEFGAAGCAPPSVVQEGSFGLEVFGTPAVEGAVASGYIQGAELQNMEASSNVQKVVMRVTGNDELTTQLISPEGALFPLAWGPERHASSNYERPGDEWGMGLVLDQPGCWNLSVSRGGVHTADFWFQVE